MKFNQLIKKDIIFLDGGFGTELIKKGLKPGEDSASAVFEHPQWVEEIHRSYVEAGSNVILANTFGANAFKLKNSPYTVEESINKAVNIVKKAAEGTDVLVALDVSTTGELLYPSGNLTFEGAYEAYKEVAICGEKAGVDLVCLETFTDLKEARIALLAVKENTDLPAFVTLSFDENGTTMNGSTPSAVAVTLKAAGASAVGLNCSLGPDKIKGIVDEFLKYSDLPVIVKPNAGLPDPKTGEYTMNAEDFAEYMKEFYENGVSVMGGCCGTSPEYIRLLKNTLEEV